LDAREDAQQHCNRYGNSTAHSFDWFP
jgi:hypothetical protein